MRIGVIGGLMRKDRDFVFSILKDFIKSGDTIVSGGAEGVDTFAREYAKENKIQIVEFLPDFKRDGNGAYMARNALIAEQSDIVLAFPSSSSSGTWHTVGIAKTLEKRVIVFEEAKKK